MTPCGRLVNWPAPKVFYAGSPRVLLFGLLYGLLRRRVNIPPMPVWAFLLFGMGPIALDGFSQLFSQLLKTFARSPPGITDHHRLLAADGVQHTVVLGNDTDCCPQAVLAHLASCSASAGRWPRSASP